MADRGDTHYHVPNLNVWFAFSSIVLLVAAVWLVLDDHNRQWKDYQREFQEIEIERAREALASPEAQAALAEEERLAAVLEEAEADLASRQAEIEEIQEELRILRGDQFKLVEADKKAKQQFNWERFLYEEDHTTAESLAEKETAWQEAALARAKKDVEVAAKEAVLADMEAGVVEAEKAMKAAVKDVDLIRKKLATLDPEDLPTQVANVIRDFPGMDFIGPNLKVRKVVLDDLTFELNFTKKPRIDMCQTCHMSIDLAGYGEEVDQPFKSHPRLDLFLTAKSAHPLNEVGCTICHRGGGESLHFVRTDHRPSDEIEAARWKDEYHWHKQHHWDYPMLSSNYIEAGCVQCHKDSMELIAPEAPKVTEGYRLFERYGCYACHKVDWYPTKRRPGPSLKKIAQKTDPEFVASWIADPRGFRPSTWMPQIFHLENWPAEDTVVVSDFGMGREIKGQEWNDSAIAAITTFLWDVAEKEPAPPIPVEGDPVAGREAFRLSGCLACHNVAGFTEAERAEATDLAAKERGTNEHGPNLRGIATKTSPEWLFSWIQDPAAYWSETRMPDLRLSDQEAADIVAYIFEDPDGIFSEVPEGWDVAAAPFTRDVVEEQARWYFSSVSRFELDRRFEEDWADDHTLLTAVGEKLLTNYGCHSCHEVSGLENVMPIGAELTTWGSKTVDKLDWGFIPDHFAMEKGWDTKTKEQFKKYREGWIEQKLAEPRSYDRGNPHTDPPQKLKSKNPTERLKMPWFDFEPEEIRAISTFVVGLVKDEVQQARMVPTPAEARMDKGLRAIRQKNCAACHVIQPGTVSFEDEDGMSHTVVGQVLPFDDFEINAPDMTDFQASLEGYEEFMREIEEDPEFELEELGIQLLRPEPSMAAMGVEGNIGDNVFLEDAGAIDRVRTTPAWGGDFVPLVIDYYRAEEDVGDVDGQRRSYLDEAFSKIRWTFAPPVLIDEGYKLQADWFHDFLLAPVPLRQQMRVKMPTFTYDEGEAGAIVDYFAQAANADWPVRTVRRFLLQTGMSPEDLAEAMLADGIQGASAQEIQGMMDASSAEIESGLPKLLAYLDAHPELGFEIAGPVDPSYESIPQRSPSIFQLEIENDPSFFQRIHDLTVQGPNCFQCHFYRGQPPVAEGPIAWAPDLDLTRERLRPDWTREWLTNPALIYPDTSMPQNFKPGVDDWQQFLPLPSEEQIEKIMIWLYNLDRDPR